MRHFFSLVFRFSFPFFYIFNKQRSSMNRIKSTFKRHSSIKDSSLEHRRSDAFIKKLEESKRFHQQANDNLTSPPTLDKSDLSKHELNAYQSWWKDLDPFGVGKADNQAVFQFVSGCGLSSATLEKVLCCRTC